MGLSANILNVIEISAFVLSFPYLILMLIAHTHLSSRSMVDKIYSLTPVWPLMPELFDDFGKLLCKSGKRLFFIELLLFLTIYILKSKG